MFASVMESKDFLSGINHTPKRVLILMSNTGGGHRAAAEAIREALNHLYGPDVTVSIVDAWQDHVAWPVNKLGKTYSWVVNEAVWLWKALWLLEHQPRLVDAFIDSIYPLVAPGLLNLFQAYRPDAVISVHPLITRLPLTVLKRARLNIPFITVVTDMVKGYHTWYDPRTTLCLVPTRLARQQAEGFHFDPGQVEVVGQPVSLKLAAGTEEDKINLRCKLLIAPHRPTILLIGGGEGFGPIFNIARNISQKVSQAQLVIVAGRNQPLKKKLAAVNWKIPTQILGFADNMPELMGAADVLVTKAGPGCIAEAFVAKLPLILFDYIPGQEEANVDYVVNHNAGAYVTDPQKIATLLSEWLSPNNSKLVKMAQNASHLARPDAALTIAHRVYQQASAYQNASAREQWRKPSSGFVRRYGTSPGTDSNLSPNPAASSNV